MRNQTEAPIALGGSTDPFPAEKPSSEPLTADRPSAVPRGLGLSAVVASSRPGARVSTRLVCKMSGGARKSVVKINILM